MCGKPFETFRGRDFLVLSFKFWSSVWFQCNLKVNCNQIETTSHSLVKLYVGPRKRKDSGVPACFPYSFDVSHKVPLNVDNNRSDSITNPVQQKYSLHQEQLFYSFIMALFSVSDVLLQAGIGGIIHSFVDEAVNTYSLES